MDDGFDLSGDVLSGCQEVAERLRIVSGIGRVGTIEWTTVLMSAATVLMSAATFSVGCQEVAECLRIVSGIGRVGTIEWTTVLMSAATFSVAAKK